jgi:hypothetical protein
MENMDSNIVNYFIKLQLEQLNVKFVKDAVNPSNFLRNLF